MQLIKVEQPELTNEEINEIIEQNMGLIRKQLHRFKMYDDAEAMSRSLEALWNAAIYYDEDRGTAFSTYATACIYNALCAYYNEQKKPSKRFISYDNIASTETENSFEVFLTDGLSAEDIAHKIDEDLLVRRIFYEELAKFKGLRQRIIYTWEEGNYIINETEIAEVVGCSQSYVSYTLKIFFNKMKQALKGKIER
jgi:DNA-directed RNA polymerase specialized sigma subunit